MRRRPHRQRRGINYGIQCTRKMIEQNQPLGNRNEENRQVPPLWKVVWVRAGGYRILAYRDDKGVWRSVGRGDELKRITEVEWPEDRRLSGTDS
jgi:hypothetical protein